MRAIQDVGGKKREHQWFVQLSQERSPLMLPSDKLPSSFERVLTPLRSSFTAPTFQTFVVLFCGFLSCVGDATVTGMLMSSGYTTVWNHNRAHRFFSRASWCPDALGMAILDLIVNHLLPADAVIELVVDDTLFKRSGQKVWGVRWHHDATSTSSKPVAKGTCYVVIGIVVNPAFLRRTICLPIHVKLWLPKLKTAKKTGNAASRRTDKNCPTKVDIAKSCVLAVAARYPNHKINVCGDAAYMSQALRNLPACITWTSRLSSNAALFQFQPPRTGKRGRPRLKGEQLPKLATIAKNATWEQVEVHRYSSSESDDNATTVEVYSFTCLWYGVMKTEPVKVVMVRDIGKEDYGIAIVTTDVTATNAAVIERYARRWSIEVLFEEGKIIVGVADARNRKKQAVERTVPFCFYSMSLLVTWFATCGLDTNAIVQERRKNAPWYRTKTNVSTADMLNAARQVITASEFRPIPSSDDRTQEMQIMQLAREMVSA